jgi:hypothetical protein
MLTLLLNANDFSQNEAARIETSCQKKHLPSASMPTEGVGWSGWPRKGQSLAPDRNRLHLNTPGARSRVFLAFGRGLTEYL